MLGLHISCIASHNMLEHRYHTRTHLQLRSQIIPRVPMVVAYFSLKVLALQKVKQQLFPTKDGRNSGIGFELKWQTKRSEHINTVCCLLNKKLHSLHKLTSIIKCIGK